MSTTTKVILWLLPAILASATVFAVPKLIEMRDRRILQDLKTAPLRSTLDASANHVSGSRVTYSRGQYGVSDIGRVRIIIEDLPFSGESHSSGIMLKTESRHAGGGGATGVGNRRFEYRAIPHGSRCTFGGMTFEFVDGYFKYHGHAISAINEPTVIVIDRARRIRTVQSLSRHP